MTISRRDLYAAGEPFGDGATREKPGGGLVCGFGGDSSSSSTTNEITTTTNTDRRLVTDGGSTAVSGDANSVSVVNNTSTTDAGAVSAGRDIALAASNNQTTASLALIDATNQLAAQQAGMAAANAATARQIADRGAQAVSDLANTSASTFSNLLSSMVKLFNVNQQSLSDNMDLTKTLNSSAQSAYADATSQANGTKVLMMVGIAAVAVVAVSVVKFKKA